MGTWARACVCGASGAAGGADGLYMGGVVSSCIFHFFVGTKWSGGCDGFGGVIGGKREESRGNLSGINGICSKK